MPHNVGRRSVVAATLASPLLAMPWVARAQARTMKMTLADTVASPVYAICQRFAANLKQKSGGAINVQVYGAGQLGSQTNALTSLQTGIVDFVAHTTGYIETIFPKLAVLDLPYLFPDAATGGEAARRADRREAVQAVPGARHLRPVLGSLGLAAGQHHVAHAAPQTRRHGRAEDPHPARRDLRRNLSQILGAVPVAIDITEVYLAMSQGAVQAVELPLISHDRQQVPGSRQAHQRQSNLSTTPAR